MFSENHTKAPPLPRLGSWIEDESQILAAKLGAPNFESLARHRNTFCFRTKTASAEDNMVVPGNTPKPEEVQWPFAQLAPSGLPRDLLGVSVAVREHLMPGSRATCLLGMCFALDFSLWPARISTWKVGDRDLGSVHSSLVPFSFICLLHSLFSALPLPLFISRPSQLACSFSGFSSPSVLF